MPGIQSEEGTGGCDVAHLLLDILLNATTAHVVGQIQDGVHRDPPT